MNAPKLQHAIPRALLCDPNPQRIKDSEQILSMYFQVEIATDPVDALYLMRKNQFQVAFIDKEMGEDFISLFVRTYPHVWKMASGESWTELEGEKFERIGIRLSDIYQYPFDAEDLGEIVETLGFSIRPPSMQIPRQQSPAPHPSTGYGYQPMSQPVEEHQNHVVANYPMVQNYAGLSTGYVPNVAKGVYSIYAPKGGVGKTTVAVNMALAIQKQHPNARVVLVDFDIFFGNVANALRIKPSRTVLDWIHDQETLSQEMVYDSLVSHPSGIWVLPGPTKAIEESYVTAGVAEKIIGHLREHFDIVIIDLGPVFRDSTIISFQYSDRIFMISDLDRTTLSDIYEMNEEFAAMQISLDKVELILNNVSGKEGISVKTTRETMPFLIKNSVLPRDEKVKWVVNNKNEPVAISLPKSPFSKAMFALCEEIFGAGENGGEKKSLFSFLKR